MELGQTFTTENTGHTEHDVWYRLYLTITNSHGLSSTVISDVIPNKSTITLDSNVPGLKLNLDGQPKTTPYSTLSVVGVERVLQALPLQTFGGTNYLLQVQIQRVSSCTAWI